ncbi:MAG TPA: glycoside hydrolase family 13 protein [Anaerolineaceae bacterium]|nr:glycoside hydrolase family 13 protein [Anaerolineaceae bacterium]
MSVPYWVEDAVFYQIFPDRFANGDLENDPPNLQAWGASPTTYSFQGGDLRGIIQKFDYLLDLGITAIYLNPIFFSTSNHRYNTTDYYRIDPKLGDLTDFKALLDVAHLHNVRVILDGVFNHCGRGFFAFNDLLENQQYSPYKDWFTVLGFPVYAYGPGDAQNYLAWWKLKSLPKFNTSNPQVRKYLLGVARYWIEQGADGWRLDVPNEIDDDSFWSEFRHTVKAVNPDAYLTGEIWDGSPRWVGDQHFDGLMNYPARDALLGCLTGKILTAKFVDQVEGLLARYPRENVYAMYFTLGSHDTERVMTVLGNDLNKVKLAYLFQFSYPGVPAIYYGDEIGLEGGKDPDSRRAFPWDVTKWNSDLRSWIQKLIYLRRNTPALRRGDYLPVLKEETRSCYVFGRRLGEETVLTAMNTGPTRRQLRLKIDKLGWKDGQIVRDLLGTQEFIVSGDTISFELKSYSGMWLK